MVTRRAVLKNGVCGLAAMAALRVFGTFPAYAAAADHLTLSDAEWQKRLTADQYAILRQQGTERPFTSELLHQEGSGQFTCAGCDLPLFSSKTKFDSGTGWPSFWAPLDTAVVTNKDTSLGMERDAVSCRRCDGHLGHVFNDGPQPTGLRYCMNGIALKFVAGAA